MVVTLKRLMSKSHRLAGLVPWGETLEGVELAKLGPRSRQIA